MAALISALDNYTPSQIGENGHTEYGWSNQIQERITQLHFQITRTDSSKIENLANLTNKLLHDIAGAYKTQTIAKNQYIEYLSVLYKMVGHTRDIIDGKGEYTLAYMLLKVWHAFNPELAKFAFKHFLVSPEGQADFHPYGSWKDVKFLHKYDKNCPLVSYGLELINQQLASDVNSEHPSLVSKWIPREKSQFKDLFTDLAISYFPHYLDSAKTEEARNRAVKKAKTDYRKLISSLNKKLDTVQIKQCGRTWALIDPENQTSITMKRQKKAFLNIDKTGKQRSEEQDRIDCGIKFKEFAQKASRGEVEVKGKRVGLNDFTAEAFKLMNSNSFDEINLLNAQWVDNSKQTKDLGKFVAMVDVSGSMHGDPMNAAIALGIRIAEKSKLGKRVMTFSASPQWVDLSGYDTFVEMVNVMQRADWGMNTNFYLALKMILDAIVNSKLSTEDVEDMVLCILSDMQMDDAQTDDVKRTQNSLMQQIEQEYAAAGIKICGKPYKPPHLLFWNLRSTSGFPTLSTQQNASMMSGFSAALLNTFCEEGLNALQSATPWSTLLKELEKERYQILDKHLRESL